MKTWWKWRGKSKMNRLIENGNNRRNCIKPVENRTAPENVNVGRLVLSMTIVCLLLTGIYIRRLFSIESFSFVFLTLQSLAMTGRFRMHVWYSDFYLHPGRNSIAQFLIQSHFIYITLCSFQLFHSRQTNTSYLPVTSNLITHLQRKCIAMYAVCLPIYLSYAKM